jgi:hypothetical protein
MSTEQEELDRRMRSWKMEFCALCLRHPEAKSKLSLGVLAAIDEGVSIARRYDLVDLRYILDWVCRIDKEEEVRRG